MSRPRQNDLHLYGRLLGRARPYWLHIVGVFLLSLLSSPLALLTPLPVKIAVDSGLGTHPLPGPLASLLPASAGSSTAAALIVTAGLLIAIALMTQLQALASSWLRAYTGNRLVLDFRSELFRYIQRLSFSYSDSRGTSDSIYRIQYDAPALQSVVIDGVIPFLGATATVVGMIYVSARIDWQLAAVALGISPVLFLLISVYRRRLRNQAREVKKLESSAFSVVQEVLAAIRVVKAFGQEDREQERFVDHSSASVRARLRLVMAEGSFGVLVGLVTAAGTAAVLVIGVRHVQLEVLTLGELLLVLGYVAQLYGPLKTMSRKVGRLQSHLASAERAFSILDQQPDVVERPKVRSLTRAAGAVSFRNVSFAYREGRPVLREISFEVPAGARVGISGKTGAGKTTLVSLLPRFCDPTGGAILLDRVDLRDYRLADLRNQFAFVLQESILFSTSIAENIAYSRSGDATEADIVAAARKAGAHDFISRLPQGYATQVGERGMHLSGGERQRIALARAFLKDAPILILDEPTSSVDVQTESTILQAMERLAAGRTTFLIAHRASTLRICDLQIRLDHGRTASISDPHAASGVSR